MGKILYQRCKVCMKGTSSKMGAAEKELEKTVNMLKACEDFFLFCSESNLLGLGIHQQAAIG